MELKEFIKNNLMQINDAIKEIKEENPELAISIAPRSKTNTETHKLLKEYDELDYVEFDVALDVNKKGTLSISNIMSGGVSKQTINRIKFRIPVIVGMRQYNIKP